MSYTALEKMKKINQRDYGLDNTVNIPPLPNVSQNYGCEALKFIRDDCESLRFDTKDAKRAELSDSDGRSSGQGQIPYNMEKDLDRLSFETAVARFLSSGSREDAFDIYYCYCEMFQPFGAGYNSTGLLLELLSEHESNASSLLMKHRDHYSHSVYVFIIGLAIYRNLSCVREVYKKRYSLTDDTEAAHHFLEYWGLASLFHDIGYPFEIAHQQMKAYVCKLDKNNNDDYGFSPYVSYRNMDEFAISRIGDLNEIYAKAIIDRLSESYLDRTGTESWYAKVCLEKELKDRAIHANPREKDYLYMDHAYFSGLLLMKQFLAQHKDIDCYEKMPVAVMDAFTAIILHNSLFKFTLRSLLHTSEPLSLFDGQPLSYLLMLCDELQCWDRASYGQNSRGEVFAYDFDITFSGVESEPMIWTYIFDETYHEKAMAAKSWKNMQSTGYTKKSGAVRNDRSKFVDDIDEIVSLKDVLPAFEPNVKKPDPECCIRTKLLAKKKRTGLYLSDNNYLNLYKLAVALNGRYAGVDTEEEMKRCFEEDLSLEYKLSNIAQAKGFAGQLESIHCFYTDRPVDYEAVTDFEELIREQGHEDDLLTIAKSEHGRWMNEKLGLGWIYGDAHVNHMEKADGSRTNDSIMRERTRLHHDIVPFSELDEEEIRKDSEPMKLLLEKMKAMEGATIYRM